MALLGKWFGFDREEIYEQGLRAYDHGDWEGAIERFETCLDHAGDANMIRLARFYLSDSYAQLGLSYMRAGDFIDAVRHLSTAIEISPNYPDLYVALAHGYRGIGDNASRAEAIQRALEINPRYVDAIREHGLLLYENGRHEDGLDEIERAVAIDHSLDPAVYRQAIEAHKAGDQKAALEALLLLGDEDSNEASIHSKLGYNYLRERMFTEAASEFEKAIDLSPRFADLHCRYGQALIELNRPADAVEALKRALAINPRYVEAHTLLGAAFKRCEAEEEAREAFERALQLDPLNQTALEAVQRFRLA